MEQKLKYFFIIAAGIICFAACKSKTNTASHISDIPPGKNKATLTLSNGKIITLENPAKGQLTMQGATRIIKTGDGELLYLSLARDNHPDTTAATIQNTLTVPRGGHFKLILPDGTKVWLNANSSITYPALFTKEKTVRIKGEVYFEIAGNSNIPFTVRTYRDFVKAAPGSSFNVSCYDDERFIKTSSLDDNVMVNGNRLKKDEAFENGLIIPTNALQDAAWSRDTFDFNNVFVEDAMRRLSRWYNIEIDYDMGIPVRKLKGSASRNEGLKELLDRFKGQVADFQLKPNALYVRPKT